MEKYSLKKSLKKIGTIAGITIMTGASISGALALDYTLSSYPAPFIQNGVFSGVIAVGENAAASDTIGQAVLLADLQTKAVSKAGTKQVVTTSGKTEEVFLGSALTSEFDTTITDTTVKTFLDDTLSFQSGDYDYEENLELTSGIKVETSLTSSEVDYKEIPVIEVDRNAIKYNFDFKENIEINKTTSTDPLEIEFLGKKLKIIDVVNDGKFTARIANEFYMDSGETVSVEGKKVKLVKVGSANAVVVDVDGVQDVIQYGKTKTINGIEVTNDEVFYDSNSQEDSSASLVIGTDAQDSFQDGDEYIGEDEDDPNWVWNIDGLNSLTPTIGIQNDFIYNDDSDNPPKPGDCIDLPNNYVSICFDGLNVEKYQDYTFEFEDKADLSNADSSLTAAPTVHIRTSENEGLEINGKKTKEAWLYGNSTDLRIFYKDQDDNKIKLSQTIANDTEISFGNVNFRNTKGSDLDLKANLSDIDNKLYLRIAEGIADISDDDLILTWDLDSGNKVASLGNTASSEEAGEIIWGTTTIGTKDEDQLTKYGIIVKNPKSNGASDEVVLSIPEDTVKAKISIGSATKVNGGITEGEGVQVNPISSSAVALAEEITDATDKNVIVVGGPAVNPLAKELFGLESSDFTPNEAIIKLADNGNKVALLVAGYSAIDTRNAALVISSGKLEDIKQTELKVVSTTQKVGEYKIETGGSIAS